MLTSWQANDPLVHYTVGDLMDLVHTNLSVDVADPKPTDNLGQVNLRYEPWGGGGAHSSSPVLYDLTVKDPLMLLSDNWDFPTNKFPNIGWLGRVHRGTPWQTVYLKSFAGTNYPIWLHNWQQWSGDGQLVTNLGQFTTNVMPLYVPRTLIGIDTDARFTQPTNDWRILDLFTTALSDNATRGQMSINQTNLAAWSALLSGVIALTNDPNENPVLQPEVIQPAGIYDPYDPSTWPPLVQLVKRINDVRATNNIRHEFSHLGDILAVPELTTASPFLNRIGTPSYLQQRPERRGLRTAAAADSGAIEVRPYATIRDLRLWPDPQARAPLDCFERITGFARTIRSWPNRPPAPWFASMGSGPIQLSAHRRRSPTSILWLRVSRCCRRIRVQRSYMGYMGYFGYMSYMS